MAFLPGDTDYIDIHSHRASAPEGIFRLYNLFLDDYAGECPKPFSVGFHPWHISKTTRTEDISRRLSLAVRDENAFAIGECGLDKVIPVDLDHQMEIFVRHIEYSEEGSKPLIIHCVKAYNELIEIRRERQAEQPWIVHGFNSSESMAEQLISHGMYISIAERILRNKEKAEGILARLPVESIFFETDDDEMEIETLYGEVASLRGMEIGLLQKAIRQNFRKVFRK